MTPLSTNRHQIALFMHRVSKYHCLENKMWVYDGGLDRV